MHAAINRTRQQQRRLLIVASSSEARLSCFWRNSNGSVAAATSTAQQRRHRSTSLADLPIQAVRETVKSSLLHEASQPDSRLWATSSSNHRSANGTVTNASDFHNHNENDNNTNYDASKASAHDLSRGTPMISSAEDALEDLMLEDLPSRYFPDLPPLTTDPNADPIALSKVELQNLSQSIRQDLLGTDHPVLNKAASYFFEATAAEGGKKIRPMMVLLLSRALSACVDPQANDSSMDANGSLLVPPTVDQRSDLPQAQRRLAEISEMIHTASLFHDDVIDGAETRRSVPSVHVVFGNKMAILAGDYLLARASICLARLGHAHVVETMSTIIEHLVRGEVMQLRGSSTSDHATRESRLDYYLRKNFYKTGSLMANSCKSTAMLGGYSDELTEAAYVYGKHIGMAFQLVDDVLDFEGSIGSLGKPSLNDLTAGLATAPVLFAAEEFPQLEPLMDRKFKQDGDVQQAVAWVRQSQGLVRTKHLAVVHAERAMEAILQTLAPSLHRDALVVLAHKVIERTK